MPHLTPGYLFSLGRSAASKITYVRPVGSPESTSNIGENPNIIIWRDPLGPHPGRTAEFLVQKLFMAHFRQGQNVGRILVVAGCPVGAPKYLFLTTIVPHNSVGVHCGTGSRLEVPWTWEKECRGPKPKSLEKVSRGRVPKVRKKSRKRSEKSKKSLKMGFWRLFGPFSRIFQTFGTPGLFRDFFETWLRAPRLLLPGPRNLKSRPTTC